MRSLLKTVVALISGLLLLLLAWNDGVVMAEEPPQMSSMFVLTGGAVFYNYDTNKLPHFNDGGDFQIKDVLVGGTKILSIGAVGTFDLISSTMGLTRINITGKYLIPGLVDAHVHASGGGGERGPASRTPGAQLSQVTSAGVTSLVGVLGTDSVTRTPEVLLAALNGLDAEGLSTWMWTGAYRVPTPTILGSVIKDVQLISKVLGVGEIALSDHRSSWPSREELLSMISDARVGGLMGGKAGIAHFHVGSYKAGLDPLFDVVRTTSIPITQMYPTHVSSRGEPLAQQAREWVAQGGYVDMTADNPSDDATDTSELLQRWFEQKVDLQSVTISSDAFGSLPTFKDGVLVGYGMGLPSDLLFTLRLLVNRHRWPIERALPLVTSNPARILQLPFKGRILQGFDADLVVMRPHDLGIDYVFAKGQLMKSPTWIKRGMFECPPLDPLLSSQSSLLF